MIALVGLSLLLLAGLLTLYANSALRRNRLQLHKRHHAPKSAILIPARDESAVIEGLLLSIAKQTLPIPMRNVYVIVEQASDPTVAICRKYGCRVLIRTHPELQRKGYVLDEALQQILPKHHYDLYYIFDADNRLSPTYLAEMQDIYLAGYDLATGYRSAKNHNHNVIAAVSALTFTMINTIGNKRRIRHGGNIIFSGTGCYISGELIERWQGWPFHSLTEDYEMSLYAITHNLSTFYHEKAVFYDEQPTTYRQTVAQRVRWIKGYFSVRRHYIPEMRQQHHQPNQGSLIKERIGVKPIILAIFGVICLVSEDIVNLCTTGDWAVILTMFTGLVVLIYLILLIITISLIKREHLHFRRQILWQVILFNPLYLLTYVPCAIKALFLRDIKWQKIEHHG